MASDVILEDWGVKFTAPDIRLDFADRRSNTTGFRRALVHDLGDKLTLNWNGDYPGGVCIKGKTEIEGPLTVDSTVRLNGELRVPQDFHFAGVSFSNPLPTAKPQGVERSELVLCPATILVRTTTKRMVMHGPGAPSTPPPDSVVELDLVEEVRRLRSEVDELKKKIGGN
jgi:hypothetical protein